MSEQPAMFTPIPLVCPYCGASLTSSTETSGSGHLAYERPGPIECDNDRCSATWNPDGTPDNSSPPMWVRYPDLFERPEPVRTAARGTQT